MDSNKNRHHELKIACAIMKTSLSGLGREWGVSGMWVIDVAKGKERSEEIEERIDTFISKAKETVPFSYPEHAEMEAG